ncbi:MULTISPECIES: 3-keto-5-aminohexanoate cleavage protein [unclassified Novosphingobium]|nr:MULTISPECIES: 3-keto-5-aminohexanoate cleavage protein [unclassified Novosphingobium]
MRPTLYMALLGLGGEIATPAEAREILSLKGGDKVAF